MTGQWSNRYGLLAVLVLSSLTLAGCELVGDIFQAGVWVGVIMVVAVVLLVGFIAAKVRG